MNYIDAIKTRKSVRTFDKDKNIDLNLLNEIKEFMNNQTNPYGLKIDWFLLNKEEYNLSSPVITDEKYYIIGKMKKEVNAEVAFGFEFEQIVLFLKTKDLGTTWMAGTFPRADFEKVIDLKDDEFMPCVTPLGYKASNMSMTETLMRKGINADSRLDFNQLFFKNDFNHNLDNDDLNKYKDIFELVRLAPSAVNKQPWRLVLTNNKVYFYELKSLPSERDGFDVQKIDLGIALNHFIHGLNLKNINYEVEFKNPNLDNNLEYILTVVLK